jgi:RNA polymerase sigma-70 factor, ECF subfamily
VGEIEDRELLRAHVAGDPDAFAELTRRHHQRLMRVARSNSPTPEDAADSLQDAWVRAWRGADTFRGEAAVATWLHRIVVNACLDRARAERTRRQNTINVDLVEIDRIGRAPADPMDATSLVESRLVLITALRRLPHDQRTAIALVHLWDMSLASAAATAGTPIGTVKSRCARARTALEENLRPQDSHRGDTRTSRARHTRLGTPTGNVPPP